MKWNFSSQYIESILFEENIQDLIDKYQLNGLIDN